MKSHNKGTDKKFLKLQRDFRSKLALLGEKAEEIFDTYNQEHSCSDCANCCKTLGPRVNQNDIRKLSKFLGLRDMDFIAKYLIRDEDCDYVFKEMPCPFLQEDNLCSVYEVCPKACREYPHISYSDFYKSLHLHKKNYPFCPSVRYVIDKLYENSR
jgi:uncharacterized protein